MLTARGTPKGKRHNGEKKQPRGSLVSHWIHLLICLTSKSQGDLRSLRGKSAEAAFGSKVSLAIENG